MKKITYSNIDSGNDFNMKNGDLYINDGDSDLNLRLRVVNTQYNNTYREYVEYLPSVLDSNVMQSNGGQFNIHLGNRNLRFATLENDNTLFSIDAMNSQVNCDVNLLVDGWINIIDYNAGISFSNGDTIKKNPVKWTLLADRNLTDNAVPLSTNGYATVADLFDNAIEFMVVASIGGEYVSTVIPVAAVNLPVTFQAYKGSAVAGSVTFTAYADTTYTVTSNADNVKVYMR